MEKRQVDAVKNDCRRELANHDGPTELRATVGERLVWESATRGPMNLGKNAAKRKARASAASGTPSASR